MVDPKQILLIGGGVAGTVGATGTIAYFVSQPRNVGELITKSGKTLLDVKGTINDDKWQKIADKYKGEDDSVTLAGGIKIEKIKDFFIPEPQPVEKVKIEDLKDKCKTLFKASVSKGEEFEKLVKSVENWCTLESPALKENS